MKRCRTPKSLKPMAAAVGVALAALAQPAIADTHYWACANGSWNATCWSSLSGGTATLGQPANGDTVYLMQSTGTDRTVSYYNTAYPTATLASLTVNASGTGMMTLSQTLNHALSASYEYIGTSGKGSMIQSAGTNTATTFGVGYSNGGSGSYALSGSAALHTGTAYIGAYGTGTLTQDGGSHAADSIVLGFGAGGSGSYALKSGSLSTGSVQTIGQSGLGEFTQSGGTNAVGGTLTLAANAWSIGLYTLSGGSLTAANEQIGVSGRGVFTQTGGSHTVQGDLRMGINDGGQGTYVLSGGSLTVEGNIIGGTGSLSAPGVSFISVDGGTLDFKGSSIAVAAFSVGSGAGSDGSFALRAGQSLTASSLSAGNYGSGTFTQSGGTVTVDNLSAGFGATGNGVYNLTGGDLKVNDGACANCDVVGNGGTGVFNHSGGTHTATSLALGYWSGSNGTYTLSGGTLTLAQNIVGGEGSSTFNLDGGTLNVGGGSITVGTFNVGNAAGSNYTFAVGNGLAVKAGTETLGNNGLGNIDQTGGSNVAGDLIITNGAYTLSGGTLTVSGKLINGSNGTFVFDGGTALVNAIDNGGYVQQSGGSLALNAASSSSGNWDLSVGHSLQLNGATFSNSGSFNLNGGAVGGTGTFANLADGTVSGRGTIGSNFSNAGTLAVDAGATKITKGFANSGVVQLGSNAAILSGGAIANSGRIEGYGKVTNAIANTGTIEAKGGSLTLAAAMANNAGNLVAGNGASLLMTGGLSGNSGNIRLNGGALNNTGHTLTNSGQIQVSAGNSQVTGNVTNAAGGQIIVSGGGTATFYDAVDVKANSELRVSQNSAAIFFGMVNERTGSVLTGTGTKYFEGGLAVGNSPGYAHDLGSVSFTASNTYFAEFGGTLPCTAACATDDLLKNNGYDRLVVDGSLSFGGTLNLASWNGYVAKAGDKFDLFDWGQTSGKFASIDSSKFLMAAGTQLDTSKLYIDGTISVAAVPEPETYAMFLAGLGLLGVAARRRKQT